jgi:hypothetical protein
MNVIRQALMRMTGEKGIDSFANGCILKIPPPSLMNGACKSIFQSNPLQTFG